MATAAKRESDHERRFTNPTEIAREGQRIYEEKYRREYEKKYTGQFAAIDVTNGKAYVSKLSFDAASKAKEENPSGMLYLIKIGSPGAFRVSYTSDDNNNWVF